jgi:hypothetical protein
MLSSVQHSPEVSKIAWADDAEKKDTQDNETFGADSIWAMLEESPQFKQVSERSIEGCTTAQSSEVQTATQASIEKPTIKRPFLARRSPTELKGRTSCLTPESGLGSPKDLGYYKKMTVALKAEVEELKRTLNRTTKYDPGLFAQIHLENEELRHKEAEAQKALVLQRESFERQLAQLRTASALELRQQEVIVRTQLAKELESKQKDSQSGQLRTLELLMKGKAAALKADYERRLRRSQAYSEELETLLSKQQAQQDLEEALETVTSQLHTSHQEVNRLREELARQMKRRVKGGVCLSCRGTRLSEERGN